MRSIEYRLCVDAFEWAHPYDAIGASHPEKRRVEVNLATLVRSEVFIDLIAQILNHETLHVVCGRDVPEEIIRSLNGDEEL